jgi:hypothetical protein
VTTKFPLCPGGTRRAFARETKLHDELDKLHKELDQVRRDGWDHGARVSVVDRHIVHIGGVVLGLVVLGFGVPFSYLLSQASSFWGASVIVAVGLGLVTLAFWTFQHFPKSPQWWLSCHAAHGRWEGVSRRP